MAGENAWIERGEVEWILLEFVAAQLFTDFSNFLSKIKKREDLCPLPNRLASDVTLLSTLTGYLYVNLLGSFSFNSLSTQ